MAKPLPIGEIVEVATPVGLLFAQAIIFRDGPYSGGGVTYWRMPTKVFEARPESLPTEPSIPFVSDFENAVNYHYPRVVLRRLGVSPIPAEWLKFPIFRIRKYPLDGDEQTWLWDGQQELPTDHLSAEQLESYPRFFAAGPYPIVGEALQRAGRFPGWDTLDSWFGLVRDERGRVVSTRMPRRAGGADHYLLFESESAAEAAAEHLRQFGAVTVTESGEDAWFVELAPSGNAFDDPGYAEEVLDPIAAEHGGVYDGTGTSL